MSRSAADLRRWAETLEQAPEQTGITELGELLEACGYRAVDYPAHWQRVYVHPHWQAWTFDVSRAWLPRGYVRAVARYVQRMV